jgi:hypothetical protein
MAITACGAPATQVVSQGNRESPPRDVALAILAEVQDSFRGVASKHCSKASDGYSEIDVQADKLFGDYANLDSLEGFSYGSTEGTVQLWFRTSNPNKRALVEVELDRNKKCKSFVVATLVF